MPFEKFITVLSETKSVKRNLDECESVGYDFSCKRVGLAKRTGPPRAQTQASYILHKYIHKSTCGDRAHERILKARNVLSAFRFVESSQAPVSICSFHE